MTNEAKYYVWKDEAEEGPLSLLELTDQLAVGLISENTPARTHLMKDWSNVSDLLKAARAFKPKTAAALPPTLTKAPVPSNPAPGNPYFTLALVSLLLWMLVGIFGLAVRDGGVIAFAGICFVGIFFFIALGEIRAVRIALVQTKGSVAVDEPAPPVVNQ